MKVQGYNFSFIWVFLILWVFNYGECETDTGQGEEKVPSYIKDLTITEVEKDALDELKRRVTTSTSSSSPLVKNDLFLLRWLRAASYNIPRAQTMLNNHLKWREDNNMDTILDEDWSDMERRYPYSLAPRDKEGKPALYANLGSWNLREAIISGKGPRIQRYVQKAIDEGIQLVMALGEKYGNVTQGHLIVNLKGINAIQHLCPRCIPLILNIIYLLDTHYIGWVEEIIIVNIPEIALPIINVVRTAINPITNRAVKVYGANRNLWWKGLTRYFDPSQIPAELGGGLDVYKDKDMDEEDKFVASNEYL